MTRILRPMATLAIAGAALLASGCRFFKDVDTVQSGFRGTAMEQTYRHASLMAKVDSTKVPTPLPPAAATPAPAAAAKPTVPPATPAPAPAAGVKKP